MKRTSKNNIPVSQAIESAVGISFTNQELSLGKWGDVDNWCRLSNDALVVLECERKQKHPNTNVLKLYPYLLEQPQIRILLIHYFFPENKAPKNRIALCKFLGEKLQAEFNGRFMYVQLKCELASVAKELSKHNTVFKKMLRKK